MHVGIVFAGVAIGLNGDNDEPAYTTEVHQSQVQGMPELYPRRGAALRGPRMSAVSLPDGPQSVAEEDGRTASRICRCSGVFVARSGCTGRSTYRTPRRRKNAIGTAFSTPTRLSQGYPGILPVVLFGSAEGSQVMPERRLPGLAVPFRAEAQGRLTRRLSCSYSEYRV